MKLTNYSTKIPKIKNHSKANIHKWNVISAFLFAAIKFYKQTIHIYKNTRYDILHYGPETWNLGQNSITFLFIKIIQICKKFLN